MHLLTFGSLTLQGTLPGQPSPQQLLLLTYVRLEGEGSRWNLARLFWPHLDGEFTVKGERRDLNNLSVARATLRTATGLDLYEAESLSALPCDAVDFQAFLGASEVERALALYGRGEFLHGMEHKTRLKLGSELLDWIEVRRAQLEAALGAALIDKAEGLERARHLPQALALAEHALKLGPRSGVALPRLHALLARLGSAGAEQARVFLGAQEDALRGQLPEAAFRYYLLRALSDEQYPVAAQRAAGLSLAEAAQYAEALQDAGLLSEEGKLDTEVARHYLQTHPTLRLELLSALREHTPPERSYTIYRQLFEVSGGFGGVGYWDRARVAYSARGHALLDAGDLAGADEVLAQFEQAERLNQREPHPETRFLHAYVLERLGQPGRSLEVLEGVSPTPEVQAMRATALVQAHRLDEARLLAEGVLGTAPGGAPALARALAANALGQIVFRAGQLAQAEMYFDQAAALWRLAGRLERELGALMNRANVLARSGRNNEAERVFREVLGKVGQEPLGVHALLNLGWLYGDSGAWQRARETYEAALALAFDLQLPQRDMQLVARVYNNTGYAQYQTGDHIAARINFNRALDLAREAGDRLLVAVALANLALLDESPGKFEVALDLMAEGGENHYLGEYQTLYENLLTRLTLGAWQEGHLETLQLYVGKLARRLEQRGQSNSAGRLFAALQAEPLKQNWTELLTS